MRKTIYNGPAKGFFSRGRFSEYMRRVEGVKLTFEEVIFQPERLHFLIKPQKVTLHYTSRALNKNDPQNNRHARITLSGRKEKVSEIERKILNKAKRFKTQQQTYERDLKLSIPKHKIGVYCGSEEKLVSGRRWHNDIPEGDSDYESLVSGPRYIYD